MAVRLLEDDPAAALAHAQAAAGRAPRLAVVREAVGLAAYAAGEWAAAIRDLKAAMRISGSVEFWPIVADCERGLGRPERAVAMAGAPEVRALTRAGKVEMRIVASGARADMGELDAALLTLKCPELSDEAIHDWSVSLWYAFASLCARLGRRDEALEWFARAADADDDDATDAAEQVALLLADIE